MQFICSLLRIYRNVLILFSFPFTTFVDDDDAPQVVMENAEEDIIDDQPMVTFHSQNGTNNFVQNSSINGMGDNNHTNKNWEMFTNNGTNETVQNYQTHVMVQNEYVQPVSQPSSKFGGWPF